MSIVIKYIIKQNNLVKALSISVIQLIIFIITKSYMAYLTFGLIFLAIKNRNVIKKIIAKVKTFNLKNNLEEVAVSENKFSREKFLSLAKKASSFSLDYTDNIIIVAAIGHHASLLYSNYNIILSSATDILEHSYEIIFEKVNRIAAKLNISSKSVRIYILVVFAVLVYGLTSFLLINFLNHFMRGWIGHKHILRNKIVYVLIADFCLTGILLSVMKNKKTFKITNNKDLNPLVVLVLNVLISLVLSTKLGMIGIILGSIISKSIINLFYEGLAFYYGIKQKTPTMKPLRFIVGVFLF